MYVVLVVAIEEVAKRQGGGLVVDGGLEVLEVVVSVSVDNGDADVLVCVVGVRGLVDFTGARGDDAGGVEFGEECIRLAGVDHE